MLPDHTMCLLSLIDTDGEIVPVEEECPCCGSDEVCEPVDCGHGETCMNCWKYCAECNQQVCEDCYLCEACELWHFGGDYNEETGECDCENCEREKEAIDELSYSSDESGESEESNSE